MTGYDSLGSVDDVNVFCVADIYVRLCGLSGVCVDDSDVSLSVLSWSR